MGIVNPVSGGALRVNVETFNSLQLAECNKSGKDSSVAVMAREIQRQLERFPIPGKL